MDSHSKQYLHVGRAGELSGLNRVQYRLYEILPGFLTFFTFGILIFLSVYRPILAAYCTIIFSVYWLFKTMYLSIHLRHDFKRMQHNMALDWNERLANLKYDHFYQLVLLPFYDEPYELLAESVRALANSKWNTKKMIVVLCAEERSPDGERTAERLRAEFKDVFLETLVTVHPGGVPGEIEGKGSNLAYAAEEVRRRVLDIHHIPYEHVVVSAFDSDTVVYPNYFACLMWYVCTSENPLRTSFQPVPLYNNNIWNAPMLSRVIAYSSSFWQMIQQERPEKLATFSSHAVLFQPLYEIGYWQKNVVSEDSRIFWNLFMHFDGKYSVTPMAYPVSMDANVGPTFLATVKNIYKQHRRWTYGAENIPYILFNFTKNPHIPFRKKFSFTFYQIEGFWSLTTHPLILFFVGWLPLWIGGPSFNASVLSYNLPHVARLFLLLAMSGLIVSASLCMSLVPERPKDVPRYRSVLMLLQWILVPLTMVFFSSIPGIESQLRLLSGRYLGFWVTPKIRS